MVDELSFEDLEDEIVERGEDGEVLAEKSMVEMPSGTIRKIKHKPITTGVLNELSNIDEAIASLDPSAVYEAFQTIYLTESILNLSKEQIRDMKGGALKAILTPVEEEVDEQFGDEEGNQNPSEMSKAERARQMR